MGDEVAGLQVLVDAEAGPGVDGGIALLGFGELGRFPVGELLVFADFLLEEDGIDFLQAHVGDVILLDRLLQLDESSRGEVANTAQLMKVVGGGNAHFDVLGVFEVLLERGGDAGLIDAEEESVTVGGQLQQGDVVPLASLECGARLGVESDTRCRMQRVDGTFDLRDGVNDMDVSREGDHRHLIDDLFFY